MQDLVAPVVEQGVKHKEVFLNHQRNLADHEKRIGFVEYDLFKSDKQEDRFEEIFRKIAEMELQRSSDLEGLKGSWRQHKAQLEDMLFAQDQKLLKVDHFEKIQESLVERCQDMEKRL